MALTVTSVQFTFVAYTSVVMQLSPLLAMPIAALVFKERVGARVVPVTRMVVGVCLLVLANQPAAPQEYLPWRHVHIKCMTP
jgi:drug/metabolite transporter (DMT)-like permease